jgi:RsiW-degrading membrane proteinase PrsW (M82 family)
MRVFLIMLGATILAFLCVNYAFRDPSEKSDQDQIAFAKLVHRPHLARQAILNLIKKDSYNVYLHYQLLENDHKAWTEVTLKMISSNLIPDMVPEYERLAQSPIDKNRDIGNFGQAMLRFYQEDYAMPLLLFDQIKDSTLPEVNYIRGEIAWKKGAWQEGEARFKKEIALKGDTVKAYNSLAWMYYYNKDWKKFGEIATKPGIYKYLPYDPAREYYFQTGSIASYYSLIIYLMYHGGNILAFITSCLIALIWVLYMKRVDIYESERWINVVLALLLGALFSFSTELIEDSALYLMHIPFIQDFHTSFWYAVIGIGLKEELVKIIPFLILLRFSKAVNEPIDYIIYASFCALGFALVENALYFKSGQIDTIIIRGMLSTTMHMFMTSIIAYGLILSKYRDKMNKYLAFFVYLAVAALIHGLFDFSIFMGFGIFSIAYIGIPSIIIWGTMINNAINQSNADDFDTEINHDKLMNFLSFSFLGTFLFAFLVEGYWFGPTITMQNITGGALLSLPFFALVSVRLTNYEIIPTYWAPMQIRGITIFKAGYNIIGVHLRVAAFKENSVIYSLGPITGVVSKEIIVEDTQCHLLALNNPIVIDGENITEILIGAKDDEPVGLAKDIICFFMLIPKDLDMDKDDLEKRDFEFVDWVNVNRIKTKSPNLKLDNQTLLA